MNNCMRKTIFGKVLQFHYVAKTFSNLDEFDSVGSKIWPASDYMIQYFASKDSNNFIKDKTILELGSGCGYTGISLAVMQAKQVILTDKLMKTSRMIYDMEGILCEEDNQVSTTSSKLLLDLCEQNIQLNKSNLGNCIVNVHELEWKEHWSSIEDLSFPNNTNIDVIIGSDVTYHINATYSLFSTVLFISKQQQQHYSSSTKQHHQCSFIISHQYRLSSSTKKTLDIANELGFQYKELASDNTFVIWEFTLK